MFTTINQKSSQSASKPTVAAQNSAALDHAIEAVRSAFEDRTDICEGLVQNLNNTTQASDFKLFSDLSKYVVELRRRSFDPQDDLTGPAAKKRKVEDESSVNNASKAAARESRAPSSSLKNNWSGALFEGISFSVPQRKKLLLEISAKSDGGVRALNSITRDIEFGIPWSQAEQIICLPVPEKAQLSRNFCVFPKGADGLSENAEILYEPIVWTAADSLPRGANEDSKTPAVSILEALNSGDMKVQVPMESEFASEVPEPHRKDKKAYHVKAFRGSKDGYLFFLPRGILWGFKKPLVFFSFATIDSVSYTSVLQRTFNLNISARPTESNSEPTEYEFSMLDQADFAGIDAYVRKHGLQDASMAEQRRAKKLNINGVRGQREDGTQDEGESELSKAQKEVEMQAAIDDDDDEEDDENFDPGSEGESEGSRTSDEDSGDEEGVGNGDGAEDNDDDDGSNDGDE